MSRIEALFDKGPLFIAYLVAGDGGMEFSEEAAISLVEGGVDLLEIGMPFSDPVADGPVIQRGVDRSLKGGMTPGKTLELIQKIRSRSDVPIILFTYYNLLLNAGPNFYPAAKNAGVDGFLVVDLPPEEGLDHIKLCETLDLDTVFIISPLTSDERVQEISRISTGFLYYACQKGTTGMRAALPEGFSERVEHIKKNTHLPVAVGFGISNKETAQEVLQSADGFVIGSLFVKAIEDGATPDELRILCEQIDPRKEDATHT